MISAISETKMKFVPGSNYTTPSPRSFSYRRPVLTPPSSGGSRSAPSGVLQSSTYTPPPPPPLSPVRQHSLMSLVTQHSLTSLGTQHSQMSPVTQHSLTLPVRHHSPISQSYDVISNTSARNTTVEALSDQIPYIFTASQVACLCEAGLLLDACTDGKSGVNALTSLIKSLPADDEHLQKNESVLKVKAVMAFNAGAYKDFYRIVEGHQFTTSSHVTLQVCRVNGLLFTFYRCGSKIVKNIPKRSIQ